LANPRFSDSYGAERAIAYWINEFLEVTLPNLDIEVSERLQTKNGNGTTPDEPLGTPFMEHTRDLDESEFDNLG
jgi:hypothetical protein